MLHSYGQRNAGRFIDKDIPGTVISQKYYELDYLMAVYMDISPEYVLEIGSQDGGTLHQWIKCAKLGTTIVNVDILQDKPDDSIIDTWQEWARDKVNLINIIEYSYLALDRVKAELPYIDFLFIDGDHSYEGAKLDFLMYGPMVRPGGVIVFHDLITPPAQPHIQVGKLWREIQHAGFITQEIWAEEDPSWGGIGVVHVQSQTDIQRVWGDYEGLIRTFRPLWKSRHLPDMRGKEIGERA